MSERDPSALRSYRWYGPDSLRAFGHRSRARQSGLGENDFYGTTYFADPRGQFVGDVCSDQEEELIIRDLDLEMIDEVRNQWAFYRDRRPSTYEDLVTP